MNPEEKRYDYWVAGEEGVFYVVLLDPETGHEVGYMTKSDGQPTWKDNKKEMFVTQELAATRADEWGHS